MSLRPGLSSRASIAALCVASSALSIAGCAGCGSDKPKQKGSITVFAASPLQASFTQIAKQFESANSGVTVHVRFGASRALLAKVQAGRSADVFATSDPTVIYDFSGNVPTGPGLDETQNAIQGGIFVTDVLSIAVPAGNPMKITGLADLAKPTVKVAIVRHADKVGGLQRQALTKATVKVRHHVSAYNAAAAVEAVATGKADATIYGSDARAAGAKVTTIAIPKAQNIETDYTALLPMHPHDLALGEKFITFLYTKDPQKALVGGGFVPILCKGPITNCAAGFSQ